MLTYTYIFLVHGCIHFIIVDIPKVVDGKYDTLIDRQEVLYYENYDPENVVSPVDVEKYEQLLVVAHYNEEKTK